MTTASRKCRVLVVDDEALARKRLKTLLAGEPDVELVGEAASGRRAVELIASLRPDVVLLDVQMPGLDGFEVIRAVPRDHLPTVVFVMTRTRFAPSRCRRLTTC